MRAGRLDTTPTTSTSRPSSSGASQSPMRRCANAAAQRNPPSECQSGSNRGISARRAIHSTGSSHTHPHPGSAACHCSAAAPAAKAMAARVIYNATRSSPLSADRAAQVSPQVPARPRRHARPPAVRALRRPGCSIRACGTSTAARCPARSRSACSPAWCRGRCRCWSALLLAVPLRQNIPVALVTTLLYQPAHHRAAVRARLCLRPLPDGHPRPQRAHRPAAHALDRSPCPRQAPRPRPRSPSPSPSPLSAMQSPRIAWRIYIVRTWRRRNRP